VAALLPPQRAVRRLQHSTTRRAVAAASPGRVGRLGRRVPALEVVLLAALLATLGLPLLPRLRVGVSQHPPIDLPGAGGSAGALFSYLIPEDTVPQAAGGQGLLNAVRLSTYTVQNGDTISAIAARFNLNMDTVISFNGIQDARALKPGTALTIPNANGLKYRVHRGDSLDAIARSYGVVLNELLDWNNLESALIVPGQELFVPGARLSEMELNRVFGRLFIYPTRGTITSVFGIRKDPFTGVNRFHNGVDLANDIGTPIVAAMSGKVAMLGYNPNFGKYIILSHPEGFQTLYGHLDAFYVKRGDRIRQGQQIGAMGNSGYSTGSHLHFSIFRRGEPVDPMRYLH
jgi:murein DD-endopeptidase MepM/ murein hydrolase activator NlpD